MALDYCTSLGNTCCHSTVSIPHAHGIEVACDFNPCRLCTDEANSKNGGASALPINWVVRLEAFVSRLAPQYKWLVADLEAVNRTRTPWVIVQFHQAMYHTYDTSHYKEVCGNPQLHAATA
jgi:hypothetical protein